MKLCTVLVFIFCSLSFLTAQQKQTVHLKDGSVLVGTIIEDNDFFVKIIIETGDTLQIGYKNILEGEPVLIKTEKEKAPKTFKESGVLGVVGITYFMREGGNYRISGMVGKRINSRWNIGLGINYVRREDYIGHTYIEPQYVDFSPFVRYYVTQSNPRLFVTGSVGYSIATNSDNFVGFVRDYNNDVVADANIGIHLASSYKVRFLVQGGLSYQKSAGRVLMFEPVVGEIITVYSKKYFTPTLGIVVEF